MIVAYLADGPLRLGVPEFLRVSAADLNRVDAVDEPYHTVVRLPVGLARAVRELAPTHFRSANGEIMAAIEAFTDRSAVFHRTDYAPPDGKLQAFDLRGVPPELATKLKEAALNYPSINVAIVRAIALWVGEGKPRRARRGARA